MEQLRIPAGYHSPLTIRETEVAIKEVKDHFERSLAKSLHLTSQLPRQTIIIRLIVLPFFARETSG